jgi:hypothetical protein
VLLYVNKNTLLEKGNNDAKCKQFLIYYPIFRHMPINGTLTEAVSTSARNENTDQSHGPFRAESFGRILSQIYSFSNLSPDRSKASSKASPAHNAI